MKENDFDYRNCFDCEVRTICEEWTTKMEGLAMDSCLEDSWIDVVMYGGISDLVYQQPCYLDSYSNYYDCMRPVLVRSGNVISIKFE